MTNDTPLTDEELAALYAAGYKSAGGGNINGDGVIYLKFRKDGQIQTSTRAEWRAVIAGLKKAPTEDACGVRPVVLAIVDRLLAERRELWIALARAEMGITMGNITQLSGLDRLIAIVTNYESDTFSARDAELEPGEAEAMAERLLDRFCRILSEGGTIICDGIMLSHLLDEVRERDRRNG